MGEDAARAENASSTATGGHGPGGIATEFVYQLRVRGLLHKGDEDADREHAWSRAFAAASHVLTPQHREVNAGILTDASVRPQTLSNVVERGEVLYRLLVSYGGA